MIFKPRTVAITSGGKGGTGKTTICGAIACLLAKKDKVNITDLDISGLSITQLFKIERPELKVKKNLIVPIEVKKNISLFSLSYLIDYKKDLYIEWDGNATKEVIRQILNYIDVSDCKYRLLDCPPTTSIDVFWTIYDYKPYGFIIVGENNEMSMSSVRRGIKSLIDNGENIVGIICNYSNGTTDIVKKTAEDFKISYLGEVRMSEEYANSLKPEILVDEEGIKNSVKQIERWLF